MSAFIKIRENYKSFTNSDKRIDDYIIENHKDVINYSAQEIGEKTRTSPASVIRSSKKLGYNGLGELKIALAISDDTSSKRDNIDDIINFGDSLDLMVDKLKIRSDDTIKDTVSLMDIPKLKDAVDYLKNANYIYLFGVGASAIVALDFQYKLLRINKKTFFHMDNNLQVATSVHITPKDVAIGISYSGRTKEVNMAMKRAKENGAKTIAITKCGKSPLSSISDIILNIPSVEKELRIGAISSRNSELFLTDTLFLGITMDSLNGLENYLINTRKIVEALKEI